MATSNKQSDKKWINKQLCLLVYDIMHFIYAPSAKGDQPYTALQGRIRDAQNFIYLILYILNIKKIIQINHFN